MGLCSGTSTSPYASGRMAAEDDRLFRPGGLDLTARAIVLAHLEPGATIVDLGCGQGHSVRYLRGLGYNAVGIDLGEPAHGASKPAAADTGREFKRVVGRAEELPLPAGSVDAVLAECSLSVVDDQDRALTECARVLKSGGRLIISDLYARRPEAIGPGRALDGTCVAGIIVPAELKTRLAHCGFTVELWEDHSQALRECAARYIMEHGSCDGLWSTDGASSGRIESAMRAARAGYFLLIASRTGHAQRKVDES